MSSETLKKKGRISDEIKHDQDIRPKAEMIWGWATSAGKLRLRRRIELIKNNANVDVAKKVLEFGCGTGLLSREISSSCRELIAIDISDEFLETAKARSSQPNIVYLKIDAQDTHFENNSFDAVIGNSVLHHLDMEKSLREVFRLLKPGGNMVFAEPNMLNPQIIIQKNIPFIKKIMGDSPGETAIIKFRLEAQLRKLNFKKILITPFDFLHPYTPKPLIKTVSRLSEYLEKMPILREIVGSLLIVAGK